MIRMLAIALLGLLAAKPALSNEIWLGGVDPVVRQVMTPGAPSDYLELFTPDAPWQQAATGVKVFKTSTQWIVNAPDATLTTMFADLNRRGIGLAVAALMLPATATTCGAGVEGYSAPGTMSLVARRIKALGGDLKYVAMDEPLWYGHHYQGTHACQSSIADVAASVAVSVQAVRAVFPNVRVGDIEPVALTAVPDWLDQLITFANAYQSATGTKLDFIHGDIQWNENFLPEIQQFTDRVHAAGIKVGLIYNGDGTDLSDLAWTTHAEQRFIMIENTVVPDHAILQSWMIYPTHMLPETQPGSMTSLVDRYMAMQTHLTMQVVGSKLNGQLAKGANIPVVGAAVSINSIDTSAAGIPANRTLTGTVPAGAVYAIWAMRINVECDCNGPADITIGSMNYKDTGHGTTQKFGDSHYTAQPGQTWMLNSPEFVVSANQPYALTVPMQIPYASRNSGYVALIWRDQAHKGLSRHELMFAPVTTILGTFNTDANGQFSVTVQPGIFTGVYAGSSEWNRSSSATVP